jgi:hypothetical protein
MDSRDILLVLIILTLFYNTYELNKIKTKENFVTTPTTEQQIDTAVKKIYLADVEAIRLLSNFAIQLSQGGTTIPGNVNFTGDTTIGGLTTLNGNTLLKNRLIIGYSHNNISSTITDSLHAGNSLCIVGQDSGTADGRQVHLWDTVTVNNNLKVNNALSVAGVSNFGGSLNIGSSSSSISDTTNSLYILGKNRIGAGRYIDLYDNVTINGDLRITGKIIVDGGITFGPTGGDYTLSGGGDGARLSTGGANDTHRFFFMKNAGQRNI